MAHIGVRSLLGRRTMACECHNVAASACGWFPTSCHGRGVAMPGKATAVDPRFPRLYSDAAPSAAEGVSVYGNGAALSPLDRGFLFRLQRQALQYFVDNQAANGLMLDRQSNHGPRRSHGLCSTSATGMGFMALALASAPPYRLLSAQAAAERIQAGLRAFFECLPHDRGVVPHFTDSASNAVQGADCFSTVETSWLLVGALWSAAFLRHKELETLSARLYERVDWHYWTAPEESESVKECESERVGEGTD